MSQKTERQKTGRDRHRGTERDRETERRVRETERETDFGLCRRSRGATRATHANADARKATRVGSKVWVRIRALLEERRDLLRVSQSVALAEANEWHHAVASNPTAALWQPKENAIECTRCAERFRLLSRRKHHCRACLRVFCSACVTKRAHIKGYGNKKPMWVCHDCYTAALAGTTALRTRAFG